ncbi:hypothetical protein Csa_001011 [Cucumis sativus]|uniref:Uncharacterized protein n=1 Tax=Cucumis sativus TaxID=3659 RepID=A0A0A0LE18_CUCSA|nr:hypothetical protein Csa_001011 [Cucumis sativus]
MGKGNNMKLKEQMSNSRKYRGSEFGQKASTASLGRVFINENSMVKTIGKIRFFQLLFRFKQDDAKEIKTTVTKEPDLQRVKCPSEAHFHSSLTHLIILIWH